MITCLINAIIKPAQLLIINPMNKLNQLEEIKKIDQSNMAQFILDLPSQIRDSLNKISQIEPPANWQEIQNVCLCGMGGSAVANHLVTNLPSTNQKIPFKVVRSYDLPAWVNENSLVILTSHSGATAETLAAFKDAATAEAKIFIVAERGQLEELGQAEAALVFDYDTSAPPRASLGYQFGAVFGFLQKLDLVTGDLSASLKLLEKLNSQLKPDIETEENFAKNLAFCCFDHLPVIVGSGILQSVAWRFKAQFNENANQLAFTEFLPEAMHNALQGLEQPSRFQDDLLYIILENSFDRQELVEQREKFKEILQQKNIRYEIVMANGEDIFSQKLSTLLIGDWTSYYLALLNKVDPTPVATITAAKKQP